MKTIITLLLTISLFGTSCSKLCKRKQSTTTATAAEVTALKAHLDGKGIVATQHPNGFFYIIKNPGTGSSVPTLCDGVTTKYTGYLLNGTIFESTSTPISFDLSGVILGWQMGIPLIKSGGSITLYLPPTLAYGSSAQGPIPANSTLIFDVDLVSLN
jgi:FKBP-type peptidyl-prolyl cis-trans isomerase FkpA